MKKIAVIGAGPAGVMCAIHAVSDNVQVVLFDKNLKFGKKLLATGNGRCNYWNSDQSLEHYHSSNSELLSNIITSNIQKEVLNFFDRLGIVPNIKDGYYYPYSNQSSSVRDLLESYAKKVGVEFSFDTEVLDVYKEDLKFAVVTNDGREYFDYLVIATGSKASPKTGSTGDGYFFAKRFGHTLVPIYPALVQVITNGNFLKDWKGVRAFCSVSLYQDGEFIKKEFGEVQLTDYGVSGICVFNLSRYISRGLHENKNCVLSFNFLPFLDDNEITSWFSLREKTLGDYSLVEFLEGVLPYKLLLVILKRCGISFHSSWYDIDENQKKNLIDMLTKFSVVALDTKDFNFAQVCSGGVSLDDVSSSLESKKVSGLYFAGEVLDVDGDCGGYNLGFAWMSGILVGKTIRGDSCDSSSTN